MILSLSLQAKLFLLSAGIGAITGVTYDIIRSLRLIIRHKKFFIQIEDGLFWLIAAAVFFYIMLKENFGEIRFFLIAGMFLGMFLYFLTLSRIVLKTIALFFLAAKKTISILIAPAVFLFNKLALPVGKCFNIWDIRTKKLLHLCRVYVKIKRKDIIRQKNIIRRSIKIGGGKRCRLKKQKKVKT